ncbi:glycosyltransferase family 4 protein [Hanstruepera ponticola]|uniref:glycosyltransferase family 4 protein n=1 Tax=Hanstruepera ponticola TaxID=2042995 RepID=UPI0017815256|nr:MraY family glycosyltransferase [Hanstruepera ponticola]
MLKELLDSFNPGDYLFPWLLFAGVLAFYIAYTTFPTILYVAQKKGLVDVPGSRSAHTKSVPTLGGIGIYISMALVITITGAILHSSTLLLVMGSLTILFFLGLKDDLTVLSPRKKFIGQLLAALLVIVFTDNRIISFSNILDIQTLPYWVSISFTLFVYILIINAYNLIDGVDGLAGTVALGASGILLFIFINSENYSLATLAIAVMGSLIAFLRLNFSKKNKLFMGDTGSMIIGFLIAFFVVSFINNAQLNESSVIHKTSPAIALAILFYPLIDTLRVVIIRVFKLKTNPFMPDRNHIHHLFLKAGFSHKATTFIIVSINLCVFAIAINLIKLNLNTQIIALLIYGSLLYTIPFLAKKKLLKIEILKAKPSLNKKTI